MAAPAANDGGLAVYVTSHGFGHLNRTAAVLNRAPDDLRVSVRSDADLAGLWRRRVARPIEVGEHVSDAGAVGPPGDSAAVDGPATLERAARVHAEALERIDDEADWLRDQRIGAVLCDAPAPPLVAAKRAGVPGFVMSNFTWADVYAPHARALGGAAPRFVAELRAAYRHATALLRIEPALRMSWLRPAVDLGMVAHRGRDRRAELANALGLAPGDKIVYFYVGRYGQDDLEWSRLERMGRNGVHFVGFGPAPEGRPSNVHVVESEAWSGGDLIASCDVVAAKAGYSTACEAMASGTPMIYPPRRGFAEFRALDRALRAWNGGVPVSGRAFQTLRIEPALERAFARARDAGPPPFASDGAERVAAFLARAARGASVEEAARKACS